MYLEWSFLVKHSNTKNWIIIRISANLDPHTSTTANIMMMMML